MAKNFILVYYINKSVVLLNLMGKMINKKFIISAILSVVLFSGNIVFADSNDLLRMDVKKASTEDTVDVTFYTTGAPTNTVVTRKTGNSYVVLLPNVAGNQSVVPALGGVKDLISDVKVKKVDDGIGGYTKITFNTIKPVKIQTYTKKTAPLTKAQQDYKNLIAQNSKFDPNKKMENFKKVSNSSTTVKMASVEKTPVQPKQDVPKTTQTKASAPNTTKISLKPIEVKTLSVKEELNKIKNSKTVNTEEKNSITPKTEKENLKKSTTTVALKPAFDLVNPPKESKAISKAGQKSTKKNVKTKTIHKPIPILPIAGACSVIGLFILGWLMNILAKAVGNNSNKLREFLENYESEQEKVDTTNYENIIDKENLNWQEKYKLYSEAKEKQNQKASNMSYIANSDGKSGTIVSNDMTARVSQMEHALSQTTNQNKTKMSKTGVQSAEDAIIRRMSGLNLKSFAKNVNLKQTSRHNISQMEDEITTNPLKESKFVNLENSSLTMSQRNIGGHSFGISDLVRRGRRFLPKKQVSDEALKQQEQYLVSSMEEYLKLIDKENNESAELSNNASNLMPRRNRNDMMRSTNPMSGPKLPFKNKANEQNFGGISVTSRYDIDSDKSIYMVESDGVSALIGKVGENVFVLKKFDKIVNKPLQVRLDYGNVYIVRVGGFKCLVDVSEDKMGTLLEI